MDTDNAALMRRYLEAMQAGRAGAALEFYADGLVVHVPGRGRHAGTYTGREAVLEYYTRVGQDTNGGFEVLGVDDVLVSERHAAILVHWRLSRGDRSIDVDRVVIYRIEHGQFAEIWVRDWDQYAYDELFADLR